MVSYYINQDDGTCQYANGRYVLTVDVKMSARITVYAHPNDDDAIDAAVTEWVEENCSEDVELVDYEIDDIEEDHDY